MIMFLGWLRYIIIDYVSGLVMIYDYVPGLVMIYDYVPGWLIYDY